MAKVVYEEDAPSELKAKLNPVKNRVLFLPPSVVSNNEREPRNEDFVMMGKGVLGKGSFGQVCQVRHKVSGNIYAIKAIEKKKTINQKLVKQVRLEVRIMYSLKHDHIIKLYNHFEDDIYFYLVMELAPKGQLYDKLRRMKRFPEKLVAQYMRETIAAVQYLHSTNPPIIHRDIKPENILLDSNERAKLCDFGWSNFSAPNTKRMTVCGTPAYLAPEMITKEGHDQRVDIWNLGVLMFELLAGRLPFEGNTQEEISMNILKYRIKFPKDFPQVAKDLVLKFLKLNPKERLPLDAALNHPWFKSNPELLPVPSLMPKAEKQLPTLEDNLREEDFEPVSRVSKVNREVTEGSQITSKVKLELKNVAPTQRSEKDKLIKDLSRKLQESSKEFTELSGAVQAKTHELELAKKECEDIRAKVGGSAVGYESPERQEIRKLKEEIMKYETINKGRTQTSEELYRTMNELSKEISQQKVVSNGLSTAKDLNKILEAKLAEAVKKLEEVEKKYQEAQGILKQEKLIKEKSKVELELKIEELKYKLRNDSTRGEETEEERMVAETAQECQISLKDVEGRISGSVERATIINFAEELAKTQQIMRELKAKHREDVRAMELAQEKALTELRTKHSKELKEEMANKSKAVEELEMQMFQYEEQEGKAATTVRQSKNLREENAQLQKAIESAKMQVELAAIGYKSMQDKLKVNEQKMQQLTNQLDNKLA
eukprot:TRINITY_DN12583_c0_g4_i1.p1 TRINITY_DN12583_c0_g4~~TRINITY_DN12583_c0_g4_i1.p1  ORF type:complete len:716 (+),score=263.74 TRINITY_DN12583_c0_g4_i1:115-2262(+)